MNIQVKATIKPQSDAQAIVDTILESRGYKTKAEKDEFLSPPEPNLAYLLKESEIKKSTLQKCQKIIDKHLQSNHDICIFGDYDADGVTATAIMWQAISAYAKQQKSQSRVLPFIPDRHKHGYGLSDKAVGEVVNGTAFASAQFKGFAPKLIITVDTGIVAHAGIKAFKDEYIEVIITDHHQAEELLPPADSIVHTTATSGAGVAWIVALYLLGDVASKLIDLATIGIVADMMSAKGLNRAIIAHGLKALEITKRPGITALKQAMGIMDKKLTTYTISFGIAPRINAAGRIYSPLDALRLLCTTDANLASELAAKIESHNKDRQEYTDQALKLAEKLKPEHKVIVVIGDYHEGVIGLVASKLVEIFTRPAIVMSNNGEVIKGSARSLPGINITDLLRSLKTEFLGVGGHDQAAGFSIANDQLEAMQKELEALADQTIKDELLVKSYVADLALSLADTSLKLAQLIDKLEPFGMHNTKPKFLFKDLVVLEDRQLGSNAQHRKLTVEQNGVSRELMLFNSKEHYPLQNMKAVIATLDINIWRDKESLQLIGSYVEV